MGKDCRARYHMVYSVESGSAMWPSLPEQDPMENELCQGTTQKSSTFQIAPHIMVRLAQQG